MIITGIFEKQMFFNPENASMIFTLTPEPGLCDEYLDKNGTIKCVGRYCLTQKYMPLKIEGDFQDSEYGKELMIDDVTEHAVSRENSELLMMDLSPSLTKRQIRKILDITGIDIFASAKTPGIEDRVCEKVNADELDIMILFNKIRDLSNELQLFKLLTQYGGSYAHCSKIMEAFPGEGMETLLSDPYKILEKTTVPFSVIDKIALANGVDEYSSGRVDAILMTVVRRQKNAGNVYVTSDEIYGLVSKICEGIPKATVMTALKNHPFIVKDKEHDVYYEKSLLKDEKSAAQNFSRIMRSQVGLPWHPEYIERIEQEQGYEFGKEQKEAFYLLKTTGFKLLTGDPGTGKTSTLKGLLRYLEMLWKEEYDSEPEIALCAPSGRAAQRMKETTGRIAQTIHKLIEYQPYGDREYYRDASNPLTADIVVVDEASMMGLSIFEKLISAIKNEALVIVIGDTNQLESVDPGNVLQDLIQCGYVDTCNLTETFRQAAGSYINVNAKKIMQGDGDLTEGNDFEIITCDPEDTASVLKHKVAELMQTVNKSSIQVLSPLRKGSCGVKDGNTDLQELINPGKGGSWYGYRNYKPGDRVIMNTNNYSLSYYNGDIGYIKKIGDSSMVIQIGDDEIVLPKTNYCDMDLAYVTTVHKSQGSEYDYIIVVLQEESKNMLNRNLFYTAVTRGKKKVIVLEEPGMIEKAVKAYHPQSRNTLLAERIQNELETTQKYA